MATHPTDLPTPPGRKQRKPAVRKALSTDAIVDVALRILDADGLDGLSMRRVAEALGTGPASLYVYVSNKDELLELAHDEAIADIDIPEPDPPRWREQIMEVGRALYRTYNAHPGLAFASLANIPMGPNSLRFAEGMLAIMDAGGVPAQEAAWAIDRFALYIGGDAYEGYLHQARQRASGKDVQTYMTEFIAPIRTYYESLPPARFPHLTSNYHVMMSGDGDQRFEFGLRLLINGLSSSAPRLGPPPPARH